MTYEDSAEHSEREMLELAKLGKDRVAELRAKEAVSERNASFWDSQYMLLRALQIRELLYTGATGLELDHPRWISFLKTLDDWIAFRRDWVHISLRLSINATQKPDSHPDAPSILEPQEPLL